MSIGFSAVSESRDGDGERERERERGLTTKKEKLIKNSFVDDSVSRYWLSKMSLL